MYHVKTSTLLQLDSTKVHFEASIQEDIDHKLFVEGSNMNLV